MNTRTTQPTYLVVSTFVIALLLSIIPIPDWAMHLRPQWVSLLVIYWCLTMPEKVGITTAWTSGLLLDVVTGSLIGSHALTQSLLAYIIMNIYQRTRVFPLWQQSLLVFALLLLEHSIHFWIIGITSDVQPGSEFWLKPVVGLFLWPWLYILLSELRHRLESSI